MSGAASDLPNRRPVRLGHGYCTRTGRTSRLLPITAMTDAAPSEREWTQIIRGEFLEIPGLRLSSDQIQKLWGLHRDACAAILEDLLHQRFLRLTADGHYVRDIRAGWSAAVRQASAHAPALRGNAVSRGRGPTRIK
jgi:hypothetical protein